MNYQIKTVFDDITIGANVITTDGTPIALLDSATLIECFTRIENGEMIVATNNGTVTNSIEILSKFITFLQSGSLASLNDLLLIQDAQIANRTRFSKLTDNVMISIDSDYDTKIIEGQQYYRDKRAQLIYGRYTGVYDEAELELIESKIWEVRNCLLFGDWYSAYKEINATVVEGAYTQALKDEWVVEIKAYVNANYSGITLP